MPEPEDLHRTFLVPVIYFIFKKDIMEFIHICLIQVDG